MSVVSDLFPIKVIRGAVPVRMECCPAFNYARDQHETSIIDDDSIPEPGIGSPTSSPPVSPGSGSELSSEPQKKALFNSRSLSLDLRFVGEGQADDGIGPVKKPKVKLELLDLSDRGHLGKGVFCEMNLVEGQTVTFVLRSPPSKAPPLESRPTVTKANELGIPMKSNSFSQLYREIIQFMTGRSHLWSI